MAKQQMTVNDLKVLRNDLVSIQNALKPIIQNARIKNEEDDADDIIEIVDDPEVAEFGEYVAVAPLGVDGEANTEVAPVIGELLEVVEEDDLQQTIETLPETPVKNVRYQRITNCKVCRTANGNYEVFAPVQPATTTNAPPKATKPKRYVRLVNCKSSCNSDPQAGYTVDDMQVGVKYTPAYPTSDYATVTKNIARIDALLTNAVPIKEAIKSEISDALKESGITKNAQKRYVRTKNYRTIKNSEGQLEVIIDASNATDCNASEIAQITADSIADGTATPLEKTLETPTSPVTVEVIMDGIPVAKTENKAMTTHNAAAPLTSNHPALQPFIAADADLKAMLALAQFCENPASATQATQYDIDTMNAAADELYSDAAPLEIPTLFPAK